MSDFRIDQITNQAGTAGPQIAGITTFSGSSGLVMPSGATEYRGGRGRGLFGGGSLSSINVIEYITISTTSNAFDFGDLVTAGYGRGSASSSTRGLFGGGAGGTVTNAIEYVTISSTGNGFDFGDLTSSQRRFASAASNSIRGIWAGGFSGGSTNRIDYVNIATLGDAIVFGDLTVSSSAKASLSSPTRMLFAGDQGVSPAFIKINVIDYITISTTGNAQDFGDLLNPTQAFASCSSSVRGIFGGGGIGNPSTTLTNVIQYVTIASLGDAVDFGDLTSARGSIKATSSETRGVFGGGYIAPAEVKTLEFITIASLGNATTFGNLSTNGYLPSACSDSHGGLGD
jgi:hypothetical protein